MAGIAVVRYWVQIPAMAGPCWSMSSSKLSMLKKTILPVQWSKDIDPLVLSHNW